MKNLYKWTECNETEGEVWHVFFQASEEQIGKIQDLLEIANYHAEDILTLSDEMFEQSEVESAIKVLGNDFGYFPPVQFGKLKSDLLLVDCSAEDEDLAFDYLYKLGLFGKKDKDANKIFCSE